MTLFLILLGSLVVPPLNYAETKVITAEATYMMGDGESPSFAEARVLQQAKQVALEQAGTYVESYTKVHNYDLTALEIQTIAGGVLEVEVLEKNRTLVGDGLRFSIKIKATVTTDKMEELAQRIKGKNVAEEYKKLQEEYARLNKEIENWKPLVEKTPRGPEREAALNQIRESEKAWTDIQNTEAAFFERLVSGELLLRQGLNELAVLDSLFRKILEQGHRIEVGQPRILPAPQERGRVKAVVSITLTTSESLVPTIEGATRSLGGVVDKNQSWDIAQSTVLVANGQVGLRGRSVPATATVVRVAKDFELSRHFQERISNLSLVVELGRKRGRLARCMLRHYATVSYYMSDPDQAARIRWIDDIIDNVEFAQEIARTFESGGMDRVAIEVADAQLEMAEKRRNELMNLLRAENERIYAKLSQEEKAAADHRTDLMNSSGVSGIFMRIAPVQSRLNDGGLYGVGRLSGKFSRRQNQNGFVAIFHDLATLNVEFILQQEQAKQISSIKAKIVEIKETQWESLKVEERCKAVP